MNRRLIVGVIGKAGSGKDTVADYLVSRYAFTKLALADPLKEGIQKFFVIPDDVMYDRVKREQELPDMPGWSVRKLLQYVGTELVRTHVDDYAWVKSLFKRLPPGGSVVVSDVRFPNEVEGIRSYAPADMRVLFIKVVRPGHAGVDVGIPNHASEIHDLPADIVLQNQSTLECLYADVDLCLKMVDEGSEG